MDLKIKSLMTTERDVFIIRGKEVIIENKVKYLK